MPNWKKFYVESNIPEKLMPLKILSKNLWWVWNNQAQDLFERVDEVSWKKSCHNPIVMLGEVNYERFQKLENNSSFISNMEDVYSQMNSYLEKRKNPEGPQIAYFSMEYGLDDSLKIFSGGLGMLAGDYLKEASDSNVNLVAVGLLYRFGYFKQTITLQGDQIADYEAQIFTKIPVQPVFDKDGNWVTVEVEYPGRILHARAWEVNVGAVKLFLMDADYDENRDEDRVVTHHLYGGDNENRLKQEMLLGLGGIRLLEKMGYHSDIYHCNEGHAAMIGLERIADLMKDKGLNFEEAKEVVRASTLFTTHTPVPAGHDSFQQNTFRHYMDAFANKLNLSWNDFIMLGKSKPEEDRFNMSYLAAHLSQGMNGVSKLHGEVSKEIFKNLYDGFLSDELNIGYVTNGVHYPTWSAKEWKELYVKHFGNDFEENLLNKELWSKIYTISNEEVWDIKKRLKIKLIDFIKTQFSETWLKRHETPKFITEVINAINPNALTIGFARRFATYKRATLLFKNPERLSKILNNPDRPVQLIFAGKAHPADKAGQDLIKYIIDISKKPEFIGKIVFVQNYDINLAKKLVQGVDVWLNTPTRPLEASGTSGEKAAMNGTVHFSVLDGWWVEGYKKGSGWALPQNKSIDNSELQDQLDAEEIYNILEEEIIPIYYDKDKNGISKDWVTYIKNTIAQVAPDFTTTRMLRDYQQRYYLPQLKREKILTENNYQIARDIVVWKNKIQKAWNNIEVKEIQMADGITNVLKTGIEYSSKVVLDLKGLQPEEVGLEIVISEQDNAGNEKWRKNSSFIAGILEGTICTYQLKLSPIIPGIYNYGLRLYPKNKYLAHRQDFVLMKWL